MNNRVLLWSWPTSFSSSVTRPSMDVPCTRFTSSSKWINCKSRRKRKKKRKKKKNRKDKAEKETKIYVWIEHHHTPLKFERKYIFFLHLHIHPDRERRRTQEISTQTQTHSKADTWVDCLSVQFSDVFQVKGIHLMQSNSIRKDFTANSYWHKSHLWAFRGWQAGGFRRARVSLENIWCDEEMRRKGKSGPPGQLWFTFHFYLLPFHPTTHTHMNTHTHLSHKSTLHLSLSLWSESLGRMLFASSLSPSIRV